MIIAELTALWQTDEVRRCQPRVRDEIRMGLDYYPSVLFETLLALSDELAAISVMHMVKNSRRTCCLECYGLVRGLAATGMAILW